MGVGVLFGSLGRQARRRPQHDDVLAQDRNRLGIGRHVEIAARHREIGFGRGQQRKALGRAIGRDRGKPDRVVLPGEGLRQQLNELLIVASRRAHRDAQGLRPQREIQSACGRDENKYPGKQDEQRIASFAAGAAAARCWIVRLGQVQA